MKLGFDVLFAALGMKMADTTPADLVGFQVQPDPKCAACPTVSPWSRIEQRDLDTVHQLWLAERITPNGGTR